jgi:UDP-2,4-diacetamido-2,4,6-trideoxy-beta-L-altropyranose hydrolase
MAEAGLLIRADAGEGIGAGHVTRSLALAQAWRAAGGRATLLSHWPGRGLAERAQAAGARLETLRCRHPDPADFSATLDLLDRLRQRSVASQMPEGEGPVPWVVLDGYHFDAGYQSNLREMGCRLLVIDDMAHLPHYRADLILNQNLGVADIRRVRSASEEFPYVCEEHTTLLLGPRYALLRPEFRRYASASRSVPEIARKVLVTLGGEDPENVTSRVVRALEKLGEKPGLRGVQIKIVVGPLNPHVETLRAQIEQSSAKSELLTDVTDMPGLMAWADVAVTAAGSTCWELAFMRVPAAAVVLAENQRIVADGLAGAGVLANLGGAERLTEEALCQALHSLCRDRQRRIGQGEAGRRLVDGRGAERVVAIMRALDGPIPDDGLALRPVGEDDVLAIWRLANAPSVRRSSLHPDPIPRDTHVAWFRDRLSSPGTRMWALDFHGLLVGQIRYDRDDTKTAAISFSIVSPFRRRGLGTMLVERTRGLAGRELGVTRLRAVVRRENAASARIFVRSGFSKVASEPVHGKPCYIFEGGP